MSSSPPSPPPPPPPSPSPPPPPPPSQSALIFATLFATVTAVKQPEAYVGENDVNIFGNVIFGLLIGAIVVVCVFAGLGYLVKPAEGGNSGSKPFMDEDEA